VVNIQHGMQKGRPRPVVTPCFAICFYSDWRKFRKLAPEILVHETLGIRINYADHVRVTYDPWSVRYSNKCNFVSNKCIKRNTNQFKYTTNCCWSRRTMWPYWGGWSTKGRYIKGVELWMWQKQSVAVNCNCGLDTININNPKLIVYFAHRAYRYNSC
jgi:hypothetical protein